MTAIKDKKVTINLLTITIIAVLLLLIGIGGFYYYNNKVSKLEAKIDLEVKLRNALTDSTKIYRNSRNELVAEKLTLQADVKTLEKIGKQLNADKQELVSRVKEVEKKNSIITAALIKTTIRLDSIRNATTVNVDTVKNNVTFKDSTENLQYNILISKVKPISSKIKPEIHFVELIMPNKQFIEFHWGDRKEGYPISFSVSNSNKYFNTVNIESYAIPQLDKKTINPTGWDKFNNFFKKSGKTIGSVGIGIGIGAAATYLLLK